MAERSVTRAGTRIGRTQPAMSAALARLRTLLRDELFVRSPPGLQPTPRALDLAEPIAHALGEIQRTLEFTHEFRPSTSTIPLSVALSDNPAFISLPLLAAILPTTAPGIHLQVPNYTTRQDAITMHDGGKYDKTQ